MAGTLSRHAQARQAMSNKALFAYATRDLNAPDEQVLAQTVRQLCPRRAHSSWTLDRFVAPMQPDEWPVARFAANFGADHPGKWEPHTRGRHSGNADSPRIPVPAGSKLSITTTDMCGFPW